MPKNPTKAPKHGKPSFIVHATRADGFDYSTEHVKTENDLREVLKTTREDGQVHEIAVYALQSVEQRTASFKSLL